MTSYNIEERFVLSPARIEEILSRISTLKAGVIGDVCLDMYWNIDMTLSELSRETPHHTLPVVEEQYSPGAAGNVAANLKAIGCETVYLCSVIGQDWRGELLKQTLQERGVDPSYLTESPSWSTSSYLKPIRIGLQDVRQEDARLDFVNYAALSAELIDQLIEQLDKMAEQVDVIAVTDQLKNGVIGEAVRDRLRYWSQHGKIVLVDSRDRIHLFQGMHVKPNEIEANRYYSADHDPSNVNVTYWGDVAMRMAQDMQAPCILTLGGNGSIWADSSRNEAKWVPSLPVSGPIDIVGAGDCFASLLVSSLGAGCTGQEAMAMAHYGSATTIKKLGTTGTATPAEIRMAYDTYTKGKSA